MGVVGYILFVAFTISLVLLAASYDESNDFWLYFAALDSSGQWTPGGMGIWLQPVRVRPQSYQLEERLTSVLTTNVLHEWERQ